MCRAKQTSLQTDLAWPHLSKVLSSWERRSRGAAYCAADLDWAHLAEQRAGARYRSMQLEPCPLPVQ